MATPREPSLLTSSCSFVLASLFAYSALVQLDDPGNHHSSHNNQAQSLIPKSSIVEIKALSLPISLDWYLWLPLYALASAANLLLAFTRCPSRGLKWLTQLLFWCGLLVFAKVVVEDHAHGIAGFWSLDMEERVVREKLGSGLVVTSMFLQLQASMGSSGEEGKSRPVATCAEYGMSVMVVVSIGLTVWFFSFVEEVRRDNVRRVHRSRLYISSLC